MDKEKIAKITIENSNPRQNSGRELIFSVNCIRKGDCYQCFSDHGGASSLDEIPRDKRSTGKLLADSQPDRDLSLRSRLWRRVGRIGLETYYLEDAMPNEGIVKKLLMRLSLYDHELVNENTRLHPDLDRVSVLTEKIDEIRRELSRLGASASKEAGESNVEEEARELISVIENTPTESRAREISKIVQPIGGEESRQIVDTFIRLSVDSQNKLISSLRRITEGRKSSMFFIEHDLGNHSKVVDKLKYDFEKAEFKEKVKEIEKRACSQFGVRGGPRFGDGGMSVVLFSDHGNEADGAEAAIEFAFTMVRELEELKKSNREYQKIYLRIGIEMGETYWDIALSDLKNIESFTSPAANMAGHLEKKGKEIVANHNSIILISEGVYKAITDVRKKTFTKGVDKVDGKKYYYHMES